MKSILTTLAAFALSITSLLGLSADEIRTIAAKPHSRVNLTRELQIYPDIRTYKISIEYSFPEIEPKSTIKVEGTEKTVEGKYIVSFATPPGQETEYISVAEYDKDLKMFKKWVLGPEDKIFELTGLPDFRIRAIAWTGTLGDNRKILSIEHHTDDATFWKTTYFEDGKFISHEKGAGRRTKK